MFLGTWSPFFIDGDIFGGRFVLLGGRETPVIPTFLGQEAEKKKSKGGSMP